MHLLLGVVACFLFLFVCVGPDRRVDVHGGCGGPFVLSLRGRYNTLQGITTKR